jgi:hypothetical protein
MMKLHTQYKIANAIKVLVRTEQSRDVAWGTRYRLVSNST